MTTRPSVQSEPDMGQKPPSEGRKDPFGPPIVWPWEDSDGELIDVEVTDDQIEENLADASRAPSPAADHRAKPSEASGAGEGVGGRRAKRTL